LEYAAGVSCAAGAFQVNAPHKQILVFQSKENAFQSVLLRVYEGVCV
jgi:hypothetical protein